MNAEDVEKSIKQMRGFFLFFCGMYIWSAIGRWLLVRRFTLLSNAMMQDTFPPIIPSNFLIVFSLTVLMFTVTFFMAFYGLGKRTKQGRTFALISCLLLALPPGFPIATVFGVRYWVKLSQPEMVAALSGQ